MSGKQPEIVFKHREMTAAIYAVDTDIVVEGRPRQIRHVLLRKRARDHNGEWVDIKELHEQDLPNAVLVLQKAYDYLSSGFYGEEREGR